MTAMQNETLCMAVMHPGWQIAGHDTSMVGPRSRHCGRHATTNLSWQSISSVKQPLHCRCACTWKQWQHQDGTWGRPP